jgi:hypothetical protein
VFLPTSQWSLKASAGVRRSRRRNGSQAQTLAPRNCRAEEVCRALIAFTMPDGKPVLRRSLTPGERARLTARAADLNALLAPCRRALDRINAVLSAPASGEVMRRSADTALAGKPAPSAGAPALAPKG